MVYTKTKPYFLFRFGSVLPSWTDQKTVLHRHHYKCITPNTIEKIYKNNVENILSLTRIYPILKFLKNKSIIENLKSGTSLASEAKCFQVFHHYFFPLNWWYSLNVRTQVLLAMLADIIKSSETKTQRKTVRTHTGTTFKYNINTERNLS